MKMIHRSKKIFACGGPFSLLHPELFVNWFCFANSNPVSDWMKSIEGLVLPSTCFSGNFQVFNSKFIEQTFSAL